MNTERIRLPALATTIVLFAAQALAAAQAAPPAGQSVPAATQSVQEPALKQRPPAPPRSLVIPEGKLHLDVTIGDAAGNPVIGLQPWDLKLTDNGRPVKILSFRSYDGATVKPDPPVEVILLIDELNLAPQQIAFVRDQVIQFLKQNGGHPAQPVTIMLLTEQALRVQPQPSSDGNGMAAMVEGIKPNISAINAAMGSEGAFERLQISLRELQRIADNEARRPSRKLLIWIGPGWPLLDSTRFYFSEKQQRWFFDQIVILENQLREARLVVYSVVPEFSSMGVNESYIQLYRAFLKPVEYAREANAGNLALGVVASESGGLVLGPSNDLAAQMNACVADANAFYRISFDPAPAAREDEFHLLHLDVDRPGVTVRTDAGYYGQPPPGTFQQGKNTQK